MNFESEKNSNNNKNEKANFFRFAKEQLSVNLDKYDTVTKGTPVALFNTKSIDSEKLKEHPSVFQKRLNSMDSAMLEESAYIVIDDPELKLERKIENLEQTNKEIKEKLIVADTISDEKSKQELLNQRKLLLNKLENLKIQYNSQNMETRLTGVIARFLKFPEKIKKRIKKGFKRFVRNSKVLSRFTPLVRAMTVRDTLGRLNKINKSVDELVKMKVPFGEQEERYQTLVNHLSKACSLHAQISKELNG